VARVPRSDIHRWRPASIGAGLVRAGEIATALAAIIGLLILLGAHLPWGGEEKGGGAATAPRVLDVRITNTRIDRDVTYDSFLRTLGKLRTYLESARSAGLPPPAIREQRRMPGVEIGFELQVVGPPGRKLQLTPTVYRAHGRVLATIPQIAAHQTEHYTSEAWKDRSGSATWAPYPTEPGDYYVDLSVDAIEKGGGSEFVESARTEPFHVGAR
jgi:hypothetical protein